MAEIHNVLRTMHRINFYVFFLTHSHFRHVQVFKAPPPMAAGLTVGCFIAAFLVLAPLPWHWRARNIPVLSIAAWLCVSNIIDGINSIIWAGNVKVVAPVWCDISKWCKLSLVHCPHEGTRYLATKIQLGGTMALPGCCLCICIHLEKIASAQQSQSLLTGRTRRMIFEATMCWLVPIVYMALRVSSSLQALEPFR